MIGKVKRYVSNKVLSLYLLIVVWLPLWKKPCDKTSDYIVSFTSYGKRISKSWMTVKTILRQKGLKPFKIILWIADCDKKFVTNKLKNLERYGLEIRYCDDYKSYKKIIGTALEYADYRIITVDDDILYPPKHLKKLVDLSNNHPGCVCCYLAHRITFDHNKVAKYLDWNNGSIGEVGPSHLLVPIGCDGILYPKEYFRDSNLNYKAIQEIAPSADDLWFKFIGLKKQIPAIKVSEDYVFVPNIPGTLYNGMFAENSKKNDEAIRKLQQFFSINIIDFRD